MFDSCSSASPIRHMMLSPQTWRISGKRPEAMPPVGAATIALVPPRPEPRSVSDGAVYTVASSRRTDFGRGCHHWFEDGAAKDDFRLPSEEGPSPQTRSDDGLASPDGCLDQCALAVAGGSRPFPPPVSANGCDMLIPLAGSLLAGTFDRVGARHIDDCGLGAVIDDRVINQCAVGGALSDRSSCGR